MTQKAIMEYQDNVSIQKNIKLLDIFVEKNLHSDLKSH